MVLDIGCGGGRTIAKLAAIAGGGKVFGIDYSEDSVTIARRTNAKLIDAGRVDIRVGSVAQLPFADDTFDLVTAIETHFFWPDLPSNMREVLRVLKAGGTLVIIAEVYKGAQNLTAKMAEKYVEHTGMLILSVDEHRELFENAGFSNIQITTAAQKGWICGVGRK